MTVKRAFSPSDILRFRREWDGGQASVRKWADAFGVSPETMRRIGRRETYREIRETSRPGERSEHAPLQNPENPPPTETSGLPSDAEVQASLERLAKLREVMENGPSVEELLDEMARKAGPEE